MISLLLMTGCSSKSDRAYESEMGNSMDYTVSEEAKQEEVMDSNYSSTESSEQKGSESVASNRKLIKRMNLNVETLEFDQLIESLVRKVDLLKGYIESSEMSGNTYLYENNARDAYMVIRIPSKRLDEFVTTVNELGNVTRTQESTEDITLSYVDTESHKEALLVEQERLLVILKDAKKLEDIIRIEERLSQVRYEIGNYESQLRTYDNLVDYSTVTLSISEVQRITPVQDDTILERMKSGLSDSFYQIKTGSIDFTVWFVTNIPYLLIWAIILGVVGCILRKRYKKSRLQDIMKNAPVEHYNSSVENKQQSTERDNNQ